MNLEGTILSKRKLAQRTIHPMIPLIWNVQNRKIYRNRKILVTAWVSVGDMGWQRDPFIGGNGGPWILGLSGLYWGLYPDCSWKVDVTFWIRTASHRLTYFNTRFQILAVFEELWGFLGGLALLEEVHQWVWDLRVYSSSSLLVHYFLFPACGWRCDLLVPCSSHLLLSFPWNHVNFPLEPWNKVKFVL